MQYTVIFHGYKNDNFQMKNCDIILIFVQNRSWVHVRTATDVSTHDLCFSAKIKKNNVYPCIPQFYYIKVGLNGVTFTLACYPDVNYELFLYVFKQTGWYY